MADGIEENKRHFVLEGVTETTAYSSPRGGGSQAQIPTRDRVLHGNELLDQIGEIQEAAEAVRNVQIEAGVEEVLGLQVEFESFPEIELAFESLARDAQGIELSNVRHEVDKTYATVFVPDGKLSHFEKMINDYLERKHDSIGRPRDNKRLINAIQAIRMASLRALWTDDREVFPTSQEKEFWWEVWLPIRHNRQVVVREFRDLSKALEITVAVGELAFPERTVLLAKATRDQMQGSILILNSVAELRRAKETAEFFDSLENEEQGDWINDLLARTQYSRKRNIPPYICLLDTGVNHGHPLVGPATGGRRSAFGQARLGQS